MQWGGGGVFNFLYTSPKCSKMSKKEKILNCKKSTLIFLIDVFPTVLGRCVTIGEKKTAKPGSALGLDLKFAVRSRASSLSHACFIGK